MSSYLQIATLCFEHTKHYIIKIIVKLLKIFERVIMFNSNEPVKAVNFQKQANQQILNGAIVISTIIFIDARKTLFSR